MNDAGMTATVKAMMTDDDGKLLIGIEHGITAEMVLNKMGIYRDGCDDYTWMRKHNHASNTLNTVMAMITRGGNIAGGMSRSPTYFFIARPGNKREEGLILYKKVKNTNGRMKAISRVGKSFIDPKKIGPTIRLLDKIAKSLEADTGKEIGEL